VVGLAARQRDLSVCREREFALASGNRRA